MLIFLIFAIIPFVNAQADSEGIVTPSVWIYDELPSETTGRVKRFPNATVIIDGIIGEGIVLQCNVFNNPQDARIIWRRTMGTVIEVINDGLISRDMSRWFIGQGKQPDSVRLEILALDQSFEGTYSCQSQYSGSVAVATVERYIRVLQAPLIVRHQSSYAKDVTEGDRVALDCNATGIPTPRIYWQRTGGSSSIIRGYGIQKAGTRIMFEQTMASDAGEYVCFAENSLNRAIWRVQLRIRHKPVVKIFPEKPVQKQGCEIMLICEVTANPKVDASNIIWSGKKIGTNNADASDVSSNSRYTLKALDAGPSRFLFLGINNLQASDFQYEFTCTASNILGMTTTSTTILESSTPRELLNGRLCSSATKLSARFVSLLPFNIMIFYLFQILVFKL
ncbi:Hemicentin-1 [Cichlidogyrus casuarinus]|uniref:Hemicentin-1 n=1 Tax=Cichlidogyrus casuarinus TaxID=1844966 RepID=A0ABD2Q7V6_9PLAT